LATIESESLAYSVMETLISETACFLFDVY
jgi:hypothetical protein